MPIIINAWCNYYTSNKFLLEECNKEENVGVIGATTTFLCKGDFQTLHMFFTIYRLWMVKININIWTAVNAVCQENLSTCHSFVSPALF